MIAADDGRGLQVGSLSSDSKQLLNTLAFTEAHTWSQSQQVDLTSGSAEVHGLWRSRDLKAASPISLALETPAYAALPELSNTERSQSLAVRNSLRALSQVKGREQRVDTRAWEVL